MFENHPPLSIETSPVCVRCKSNPSNLLVRAERLCRDCFMSYVAGKVIKAMDRFKLRGTHTTTTRRILLPLSLGLCSSTLLHVLNQQLEHWIKKTGRTGYELHVLFVDDSSVAPSNINQDLLEILKETYTQPIYHVRYLEQVLSSMSDLHEDCPLPLQSRRDTISTSSNELLKEQLRELLSSLPSESSKADIIAVLRTRLIVEVANELSCEAVAWGDSTTRLAERTLAETAKGRGFSLPWLTSDGISPHGLLYVFPMRELFRKEVQSYAMTTTPSLPTLITETQVNSSPPASSKDTTIDALMVRYFASVEMNYPSIVANVVRTSSKLNSPKSSSSSTLCEICKIPVAEDTGGLAGLVDDAFGSARTDNRVRCYGCARSAHGMKTVPSRSG